MTETKPAAPAILKRIKELVLKFQIAFPDQTPTGLFVPANQAGELTGLVVDMLRIHQPNTDPQGLVLAQLLGLQIRLCTGRRLGVGLVAAGDVPLHAAVFE